MRILFALSLVVFLLGNLGCKSSGNGAKSSGTNRTAQVTIVTNKPVVRPVDMLNGRVIAVRQPLRFVIVDFPNSRLPRLDQHLTVYRLDQKVAEIKVSGPYLGTTVAADVTAGEAMEGDLVRDR